MHDRIVPKTQALAERLRSGEFIAAPGVYDMISARVADSMGFPAIYMTGSGVVASHLGLPDAGIATYTEMVSRAGQIAAGTRTPLIADADTGYGGTVNVRHTVQGYERAGVAAIQIEDQAFPKKCGHTEGMRLIPLDEMVRKIRSRSIPGSTTISSSSRVPTPGRPTARTRRCAGWRPSRRPAPTSCSTRRRPRSRRWRRPRGCSTDP